MLHRLRSAVATPDFLHSAWLGGADANALADEFSDIDLWLDVKHRSEGAEVLFTAANPSLLPPDVVARLQELHSLVGPDDLRNGVQQAHHWMVELEKEIRGEP